jgi:AmmeMemoRadiSam system protein A
MDENHTPLQPPAPQEGRVPDFHLTKADREVLHRIARQAILHGLESEAPPTVDLEGLSQILLEPGAAFVTLQLDGRLRGCIGSLLPRRSLAEDVAHNAYGAAFGDFRFPPLSLSEFPRLELHISVLTPLVRMEVESREELLKILRPGIDGLVLDDPPHRSTFLPQVWESLPDPEDFVGELLVKGGLPRDHWSSTLKVERYSVVEI